ncbi:MAG: ABC transporter permease [Vicinamibacterales bacterium]
MSSSNSEPRPMYWSIQREIWENRSVYIAPIIVAAVVLFGTFITIITVPMRTRGLGNTARLHALATPFRMAPAPIMLCTFLVGLYYCLDALYGERRERSILFWKSLPVSDRTTVLSKAAIPFVVLPSIAYALSVIAQVLLLFASTVAARAGGMSVVGAWSELRFFESLYVMAYGLVVHALWFAPVYGYLMLISGWAKRAAFLWVVLPPLALMALERIVTGTTLFGSLLRYRVTGAMTLAFRCRLHDRGSCQDYDLTPGKFLSSPGLWLGLMFAAACLFAAIRLRRNREPI